MNPACGVMGDPECCIQFLFDSSAYTENDNDSLTEIPIYESGTTRIPADLIARKPKAYKPHTISLGPIHFGQSQLKDCEVKKERLIQGRFPYRVRHFKTLVENMKDDLSRIRKWYPIAESIHEERNLVRMMVLDGIFLLQFLREISPMSEVDKSSNLAEIQEWADLEDFPNLEKNVTRKFRQQLDALTIQEVQEDIMKLQNQIPLFALEMIIQWEEETYQAMKQMMLQQKEGKEMDKKLQEMMLQDIILQVRTGTNQNFDSILRRAWHSLSPFPDMHVKEESLILPGQNAHILGFVYQNILEDPTDLTQYNGVEGKKKRILPARAVALDNKGVKFAALKGPLHKIHFDGETWTFHLPRIEICERTDAVLRNLVAFELYACDDDQPKPIKCYVELMDQLINTAEDVEVLKNRGIIQHHLGTDQEVADIWNKMSEGLHQNAKYAKYGPIDTAIEEVIKFYGSYRIWFAEGVKKFLSKPWLVVSFSAGCIIVITAILQTIFSGLQLHHN